MYLSKIAGTKLVCALENDQGQWYLRIKLGNSVEAEVPVTHMTKRAILANLQTVFMAANVPINDFQLNLIHKDLTSQISHLLAKDGKESKEEKKELEEKKEDPRIDNLLDKIDKLEKTIKTLEERIERVENLVGK